jgi:hypothetical protein
MKFVNILLFLSFLGNELEACICGGYTIEDLKELTSSRLSNSSDEIFLGKLVRIDSLELEMSGGDFLGAKAFRFRVLEKWVGNIENEVEFYQISIGCDTDFERKDSVWIVSLRNSLLPFLESSEDSLLITDLCSMNINQLDKEFDVFYKQLNQLFPNEIKLKNEQPQSPNLLHLGLISITLILGFIFGKKYPRSRN